MPPWDVLSPRDWLTLAMVAYALQIVAVMQFR